MLGIESELQVWLGAAGIGYNAGNIKTVAIDARAQLGKSLTAAPRQTTHRKDRALGGPRVGPNGPTGAGN